MKERFKLPEQAIRLWFWLFAALCLIAAVIMPLMQWMRNMTV